MSEPLSVEQLFPINRGDEIRVGADELISLGYGYISDDKLTIITADSGRDPGWIYPQWYIADVDGDGTVDMALVNNEKYEDYQACSVRARADKPDDFYYPDSICKTPSTLYLAKDVVMNKVVAELLNDVSPQGFSSIKIVERQSSDELTFAQYTFNDVMRTRQELKERFLAKRSYGWYDGQVFFIQDPLDDFETGRDKLEVSSAANRGARLCFKGIAEHPANYDGVDIEGSLLGVYYEFNNTPFSDEEVIGICDKIVLYRSFD